MVGGLRIGKRLRRRLNRQQQQNRSERMNYRSNTFKEIAINRGGINALADAALTLARRQKRLWWFALASIGVQALVVGRIVGWW